MIVNICVLHPVSTLLMLCAFHELDIYIYNDVSFRVFLCTLRLVCFRVFVSVYYWLFTLVCGYQPDSIQHCNLLQSTGHDKLQKETSCCLTAKVVCKALTKENEACGAILCG